ncbi:hypothetical protein PQ469_07285 [Mucilaginibacter sp. KACC 22773]|uniref:hypothetical protein n=1 Tax=Mucilaginibacter sp. KACC 22773 TaxID=3025671 RepID=UPI0023655B81|nr:hypothetical protein [Mucilaginibacter sp. KACC 22773]WDF79808.1 hypothetical protein PQ469_07285 [Mucilaginibacter sp. KACC 22773]
MSDDPLKLLDDFLESLIEMPRKNIRKKLNIDYTTYTEICEKLVIDGYAISDGDSILITFNGRFFISVGGYVRQQALSLEKSNRLDNIELEQR